FTRSGDAWSQQQKLVGTGVLSPPPGAGQGSSVALSADANTVLVGGPEDNNGIGAAWVYTQPVFAGTPGYSNCYGKSVTALPSQYPGLNAAAAAWVTQRVGAAKCRPGVLRSLTLAGETERRPRALTCSAAKPVADNVKRAAVIG